ncbi:MAG TPA: 2-C-methyl-D-erythritol 2,4-cyclodiphosphate synthase [Deinococcales bacterium]|nr:2-C-methyl-D-erythritol 2,4-cyclodiphosphate synthase [Deinococcales bacterium]
MSLPFRVGLGEDSHRLSAGRPLVLAGVALPDAPAGAVAHSDGDAVLHAVADAILAALAAGDIGRLYPDTAPENAGLDSRVIVKRVLDLALERGWRPAQASLVVTLDRPKLGPRRDELQASLAGLLGLEPDRVGLGFKTSEGLAPEHVQVRAVVLLEAADVSPGAGAPGSPELDWRG